MEKVILKFTQLREHFDSLKESDAAFWSSHWELIPRCKDILINLDFSPIQKLLIETIATPLTTEAIIEEALEKTMENIISMIHDIKV